MPAFISLATIAVALLTYDLLVRSAWLGQLLNGRRERMLLSWTSRRKPTGLG